MMTCPTCRTVMKVRRGPYKYTESGLPNLTLHGIDQYSCPKCGETAVAIPRPVELHRLIARAIIRKAGRLHGREVRFLRTHLEWTGAELAQHLGVTPESVSRWENDREPIGPVADRLLRMVVSRDRPSDFPLESLTQVARDEASSETLEIRHDDDRWRSHGPR